MSLKPRPAGFLDENTEYIDAEIERMKRSGDDDRILTGFKHIDDCLVISKKLRPFIGIMGFANDGKTTVLRTMLYNMAQDGKTVVLFSKEEDPLDAWMAFAFLHSHHYRDEFILPSLMDFQKKAVTDEDWARLNRIIDDIKNRKNLKGRIEVQRLTDWDSLVSHLKTNHKRVRYDVVAADYLSRIDIPWGKPQFHNQNMAVQIGMTQGFTRDFDDGAGMVFITPIQINRSGYTQSKKKKEGEKKHDLTSVNQHSEFYQDMDFIISIFRDDVMKQGDMLLMETQKVRGAAFPPNAALAIDSLSRCVCPPSEATVGDAHFQDYLSGKVQSPVSKYMKEEVIEQNVFDSLDIAAGAG
jgi:replicative DNA helicase